MRIAFVVFFVLFHGHASQECLPDCQFLRTDLYSSNEGLLEILNQIRITDFFRIFKVQLHEDCPFWRDQPLCAKKGCSVEECCWSRVPDVWKREAEVKAEMSPFMRFNVDDDTAWVVQADSSAVFIDLEDNHEGYTGYVGEEPHKIWAAIHENCFDVDGSCKEHRIFSRLISGFHSEVSTHISGNFPIEQIDDPYELPPLGPSRAEFERRLGAHPEWIENLYFTYVFLLRATNKAKEVLLTEPFDGDDHTQHLIKTLLTESIVSKCCRESSFNELELFQDDAYVFRDELREKFRNISRILDCTGCTKCRLHGKLQVLGIGTALKILFTESNECPELQRNEIVALIVTLAKFSEAINLIQYLSSDIDSQGSSFMVLSIIVTAMVIVVSGVFFGNYAENNDNAS